MEMTKRVIKILDAKYEKADLPKIVSETCDHLSNTNKKALLMLLQQYEELFDGTLGSWDTEPVHFELKPDAKPFHGRPYPVPQIHKEALQKS